jgi:hypothetical protein
VAGFESDYRNAIRADILGSIQEPDLANKDSVAEHLRIVVRRRLIEVVHEHGYPHLSEHVRSNRVFFSIHTGRDCCSQNAEPLTTLTARSLQWGHVCDGDDGLLRPEVATEESSEEHGERPEWLVAPEIAVADISIWIDEPLSRTAAP